MYDDRDKTELQANFTSSPISLQHRRTVRLDGGISPQEKTAQNDIPPRPALFAGRKRNSSEKKVCGCPVAEYPGLPGAESRNLAVCIDGTSNQFGLQNTNVIELYGHILRGEADNQLTYYDSGIGTYARPSWKSYSYLKQVISNKIDLAIAWNLEKVILGAYRWLSNHYRHGDKIFLFGFSRGAYQVRALAGMIEKVGLILPGNEAQIPFAYELYAGFDPKAKEDLAPNFKSTFSRENVRVHFVGAWDTVSSVGVIRNKKILPYIVDSCQHICVFRHALALDERRVKFLPEYVHEGASHTDDEDIFLVHKDRKDGKGRGSETNPSDIKEVWFAGSHSDIGGGNRVNTNLQSGDIPLLWMRNEAIMAGLRLRSSDINWKSQDLEREPMESLTFVWRGLECLPLKRLSYENSRATTFMPHMGTSRKIVPGQKIHTSVIFRPGYRPKPAFPEPLAEWPAQLHWDDPASHQRLAELGPLWEKDLFDPSAADILFDKLCEDSNLELVERVAFMASFDEGRRAISKVEDALGILVDLLQNENEGIKISAAIALSELVKAGGPETSQYISEITKADCLRPVVNALETGEKRDRSSLHRSNSLAAIAAFSRHETLRGAIIQSNVLWTLVRLCNRENIDPSIRTSSAQALSCLLNHDEVVDHIVKTHMTGTLVDIGKNQDKALVASSARIVTELAAHDATRSSIIESNAIEPLLELLTSKSKNSYATSSRMHAVYSLAQHDDSRAAILNLRGIEILEKILSSGEEPSLIRGAAKVLLALSKDHIKSKAVMMLIKRMKSTDKQIWTSCFAGLMFLASHDDIRAVIIQQNLVQILVKKFMGSNSISNVANALNSLAGYDDFRAAVIESDLLRSLGKKLHSKTPESDISEVIASFVEYDDMRAALIESDFIDNVVLALRSNRIAVIRRTREVIITLSAHADVRAAVLKANFIQTLVKKIRFCNPTIVFSMIERLLAQIDQYDDIRDAIINSDFIPIAMSRVQKYSYFRKEISQVSLHDETKAAIARVGICDDDSSDEELSTWAYLWAAVRFSPLLCLNPDHILGQD